MKTTPAAPPPAARLKVGGVSVKPVSLPPRGSAARDPADPLPPTASQPSPRAELFRPPLSLFPRPIRSFAGPRAEVTKARLRDAAVAPPESLTRRGERRSGDGGGTSAASIRQWSPAPSQEPPPPKAKTPPVLPNAARPTIRPRLRLSQI
ncbi:hypothetical protein PX52LOC_06137 [Limnoglobus roseus]|uniref:Uncharacterized protein n=2 Tax=Limnoglobus roseus TaxID=2598579 RepID=A0A5C1AJN7_9BACT|nr:hypothetical protein PX52LOC_06137 [Limnoglobus roseus]